MKRVSHKNGLTIDGDNSTGTDPVLTRTSGAQQVLMCIDATNVTVRDMHLTVNQNNNGSGAPIAPVGIAAVSAEFDGL